MIIKIAKALLFTLEGIRMTQDFHILKIAGTDAILGIPWLKKYNLRINWQTHQIQYSQNELINTTTITRVDKAELFQLLADPTNQILTLGARGINLPTIPNLTKHKYFKSSSLTQRISECISGRTPTRTTFQTISRLSNRSYYRCQTNLACNLSTLETRFQSTQERTRQSIGQSRHST
jgi:hypothetical protein